MRLSHWATGYSLFVAVILASGCGTGLLGPRIYTTDDGTAGSTLPASPLPALQLDQKLYKAEEQVLYGRVVIDGKPAKRESVEIFVVPTAVLEDKDKGIQLIPGMRSNGVQPKKPKERTLSTSVASDDGFYMIKGVRAGEYRVYFHFGTALKEKRQQLLDFESPLLSPFTITMVKGQFMQDLVIQSPPPESTNSPQ
ncbi:hypothetical protein [Planctomicrobium piriforme]|uniref:Carboxypeptidase regulatory-like domain-containing protein n=1 Tax=Planctomicrobium piriforme TaxID=1576369 RepID=A0A1I3J321_9PLAN|nr:hypothetical protein [Planctomicrobium piriforme]SFI54549.1 hypothetical protein SAMN05421753_11040 [Planctomicrobium piriforme]